MAPQMHSTQTHNPQRCAARRRGFTLVEMLVALAVLTIALAVVTTVFSVTTRTAQQATALAEVEGLLRSWELQVEQDLAGIDPSRSVMVMHGRTIAAAKTAEDLPAQRYERFLIGDPNEPQLANYDPAIDPDLDPPGSDGESEYSNPRADILMFFTTRPSASQAPPQANSVVGNVTNDQYIYARPTKFSLTQVVYGHAALDSAVESSAGPPPVYSFANNLRHVGRELTDGTDRSELPLQRWHLARRAVIIDPNGQNVPNFANVWGPGNAPTDADRMGRVIRCFTLPNNTRPGDVAPLDFPAYLRFLSGAATAIPYAFEPGNPQSQNWNNYRDAVQDILYAPTTQLSLRHVATVIENPPANLRTNLGLHGLPACAWFKVEFLIPEDPRNAADYFLDQQDADVQQGPASTWQQRHFMPRWTEVTPGQTYVFVPDSSENRAAVARGWTTPTGGPILGSNVPRALTFVGLNQTIYNKPSDTLSNRKIRLWPYAIRVTVRVYDPRDRLSDPIERTVTRRFD